MHKAFCRKGENLILPVEAYDQHVGLAHRLIGDTGFRQTVTETDRTIVGRYQQNKRLTAIGFAKHTGEIIHENLSHKGEA